MLPILYSFFALAVMLSAQLDIYEHYVLNVVASHLVPAGCSVCERVAIAC